MESTALEVGIGLAVVFFLAATLVTALNEGLTRLANLRSKALWATLATLLGATGEEDTRQPVNLKFLGALRPGGAPRPKVKKAPTSQIPADAANEPGAANQPVAGDAAAEDLLATPSIWSLDYVKANKETKVWNIPTKVFTSALLELATIKGAGDTVGDKVTHLTETYADSPLGQYLASNAIAIGDDVDKFTDRVGAWFDGQMERLTDSYRRLTKYILAAIGLLVAIAFNVDSIAVASGLATNADERQAVVLLADNFDATGLPCPDKAKATTEESASTPAGEPKNDADAKDLKCAADNLASIKGLGVAYPGSTWRDSWKGDDTSQTLSHLLGLALTTVAVGLGGPFWFDTVGVLAGLRRKRK